MAIQALDEETSAKIIRQVEYYLGDISLPKDNFLQKTISESDDGLVSLALICCFSKMKSHLSLEDTTKQDDVSEDIVQSVAETLRQSTFLKVSEDGKKVGRAYELAKPEEVIKQVDVNTVAASPLEHNVKQEDVESYFGQFGKVTSVRMPRHVADKKIFSGTALVEYSTEEDAENILKQSLVYGGLDLVLKPKKDFDAEQATKADEFRSSCLLAASNVKETYPEGVIVAFKLKSKSGIGSTEQNGNDGPDNGKINEKVESTINVIQETEQKVPEDVKNDDSEEKVENCSLESEGKKIKDEERLSKSPCQKTEEKATEERRPTAVAYKENMDVVIREDLKAVFQKYGTIKFIDFSIGEESGYVRFEESEAVQRACADANLSEGGGLMVKNYIATLETVTGEAEKVYWNQLRGNQDKYHYKSGRGRGGKFSRGGRFSRSRESDNGKGRANKVRKVGAA